MTKYRRRYELSYDIDTTVHIWSLVGPLGGLHLSIREYGREPSGGIEIHYRFPPDYMAEKPPHHDRCWLLGCPCWTDGSSLEATEYWIPLWQADPHNHKRMFEQLEGDVESRFNGKQFTVLQALATLTQE